MPKHGKFSRSSQVQAARKARRLSAPQTAVVAESESTPTEPATASMEPDLPVSTAAKKLTSPGQRAFTDGLSKSSQQWFIRHVTQMSELIGGMLCPDCYSPSLSVSICEEEHAGLSSRVSIRCLNCLFENCTMSSPRERGSAKRKVPFVVNKKMCLFSHEVGASNAALVKFSTVMGIPGMHLKTFQHHDKVLTGKILHLID